MGVTAGCAPKPGVLVPPPARHRRLACWMLMRCSGCATSMAASRECASADTAIRGGSSYSSFRMRCGVNTFECQGSDQLGCLSESSKSGAMKRSEQACGRSNCGGLLFDTRVSGLRYLATLTLIATGQLRKSRKNRSTDAVHLQHDVHALGRWQALVLGPAEGVRARLQAHCDGLATAALRPCSVVQCSCHSCRLLPDVVPSSRGGTARTLQPHQHDVQQHAAGPHVGGLGVVRLALGGQDDLGGQVRRRAHPRPRGALEVLVLHHPHRTSDDCACWPSEPCPDVA